MRRLTILTTSLLASLAAAAPAPAATISPAGVRFPDVAVNPDGAVVVAWERQTKRGFAIEVRAGASPSRLGPVRRLTSNGDRPKVAIGADGTRAVQWVEYAARSRRVRVAVARPGRDFGRGQVITRRAANLDAVAVAVQPDGRVVAVVALSSTRLGFALAPRNRAFGDVHDLTANGPARAGTVAIDPRDGAAVLAYTTPLRMSPPRNQQAAARTLAMTATEFSAPAELSDPAGLAESVPIVAVGSGAVGVTYARSPDTNAMYLARRNANGSWAAPELIAKRVYAQVVFALSPIVTLPTDGSALAAWTISADPLGLGATSAQTEASIAQPGSAFGAPSVLTPANEAWGAKSVASAGAEAFLATARRGRVLLATREAGGAVLRTRTVAYGGDGDVLLAAGGSHVLLAYQQHDRLRLRTVR